MPMLDGGFDQSGHSKQSPRDQLLKNASGKKDVDLDDQVSKYGVSRVLKSRDDDQLGRRYGSSPFFTFTARVHKNYDLGDGVRVAMSQLIAYFTPLLIATAYL